MLGGIRFIPPSASNYPREVHRKGVEGIKIDRVPALLTLQTSVSSPSRETCRERSMKARSERERVIIGSIVMHTSAGVFSSVGYRFGRGGIGVIPY